MKLKTHSGAKKRLRPKKGGKIKKKMQGRRHLLEHKKAKTKRNKAAPSYVNDASQYQADRMLIL